MPLLPRKGIPIAMTKVSDLKIEIWVWINWVGPFYSQESESQEHDLPPPKPPQLQWGSQWQQLNGQLREKRPVLCCWFWPGCRRLCVGAERPEKQTASKTSLELSSANTWLREGTDCPLEPRVKGQALPEPQQPGWTSDLQNCDRALPFLKP